MSTFHGIPFNGGMNSPTGTGAQHIVETTQAICSWLIDGTTPGRLIESVGGVPSLDWPARAAFDDTNQISIDWNNRALTFQDGDISVDWQNAQLQEGGAIIISWASGLAFFGAGGVSQQAGGAAVAGAVYGATERAMLNAIYSALRAYGLLT